MNNWYGQYPSHWKLERLQNHLVEINESNNPVKSDNILSLTNKLGVVPYSEKGNQGNVAKENLEGYKLAYPDTIVCNCMNVLIGSVGISKYYGCVSPVYYVYKAKDNADLEFINYVFQTVPFQKELRRYANGILEIRLRVSSSNILKREIPIPSKDEQVRIVKAIKSKEAKINALIANEEKQIEKLKAYKQALISEVVTKGLDPNVPMKDSGVKWIGYVPKGWNILYLKQISIIKTGSTPPTSISEYFDGEINWYTPSDFRSSKTISSERKLTNKAIVDLNINLFPKHTTLIVGIGGTAGKISIIENAGYSNQQITAILSKKDIDKKYLYYCLTAASKYLKDNAMYTTLPIINNEYLKNFKVCVPDLNEQNEISKFLEEKCLLIDSIIECHNFRIKSFKEYRQSIIYEYVTGKREV